jgi:hypothetical protein
MRRFLNALGIVAAVLLVAGAVALSYATTRGKAVMVGVVVAKGSASVEATDQLGVQGELRVARVLAPGGSWLAVYNEGTDGMAASRVGLVHISAGESRDVVVPLDPNARMTERVDVVLQADRGTAGLFEFDEARFATSPDKPYFIGGKRVQALVRVRFSEMGNTFQSN